MVGWGKMEWGGQGCWQIGAALMRECDFGPLGRLWISPILNFVSLLFISYSLHEIYQPVYYVRVA